MPGPMDAPQPVDVVLPCLDEAAALPALLGAMPLGYRPIVVDNGSTDATAEVAAAFGATVIHEPRRGFGAAAHAGLCAATAEIVAFCDGDGSFDPLDLDRVCEPIRTGTADLVLGRRRPTAPRAWPLHARLANAYLAGSLRRRTGAALHDLGPLRAARRTDLLALGLQDRRSGYPLEMVLRAARSGWRIAEVDVSYHPRVGRSKVTGTARGTMIAISDMSRLLRERAS
ncbi:glycosyltransferase family 2 protein [Microbacterium sp. HD4P20]|uniref:glycosyltransferase family 2 protein n=1 Tax=Microbacterium sp. HD4P20 TaxID=2864874 RepID=UPI001C6403D0|nr:glycosyltransferase family 2 protein [Microbacterium sp. HD4P20]MCP2637630.1 glycosyltransferase family 2 protein [Microbacterium sp. HD4P20]